MIYGRKEFITPAEAERFTAECERGFEHELEETIGEVTGHDGLRLIGLSGPTCSGKTTAAKKITDVLRERGKHAVVVSIDDFYYDKDKLHKMADEDPDVEIDYDSEDTIDFDTLETCVSDLLTGKTASVPTFDFIKGGRTGYRKVEPDKDNIYIFEGIQAIYPKVTKLFTKFRYKSVYISVEESIDVDGTVFTPDEIRFIRRTVRDFNFRGASPEFTFYLWKSVRANEEANIFPNKKNCDYTINSGTAFELNLFAPYIVPLLRGIAADNAAYAYAERLLGKFEGICGIPTEYLSQNSLYYEFVRRK